MTGFQASYPGATASLRHARSDLYHWLASQQLGPDVVDRAALVRSELATNAIQASPKRDFSVRVARDSSQSITISVTNETDSLTIIDLEPLLAATTNPMPDATAVHGWGLPIVAILCDHIEVGQDGGSITITGRLST